jgi:hypothetical protein
VGRIRKSRRSLLRCWGLNPVRDRERYIRLYPYLREYLPFDPVQAKRLLAKLEKFPLAEPAVSPRFEVWRLLNRDARGRWRKHE